MTGRLVPSHGVLTASREWRPRHGTTTVTRTCAPIQKTSVRGRQGSTWTPQSPARPTASLADSRPSIQKAGVWCVHVLAVSQICLGSVLIWMTSPPCLWTRLSGMCMHLLGCQRQMFYSLMEVPTTDVITWYQYIASVEIYNDWFCSLISWVEYMMWWPGCEAWFHITWCNCRDSKSTLSAWYARARCNDLLLVNLSP